jgi:hypothetical protein
MEDYFVAWSAIDKKNPGQNWSGVINQGASTISLSWRFASYPESGRKIFNGAI